MDYVESSEFGEAGVDLLADAADQDLTPAKATVEVSFKAGSSRSIELSLPLTSSVFNTTLTRSNILDYVGSAYSFAEDSFLVLPTDGNDSHMFIEISATNFIEVVLHDD